jgi:uncharacterized membrane protein
MHAMPAPAVRTLLSCAALLLLGACGARESAPSTDDTASPPAESAAPLETASEPGSDGLPSQRPAAKHSPDQAGEPLLAYRAIGTEPFWSVRTEGDRLLFTTPENQTGTQLAGTPTVRADGIRYAGSDGGTAFELDIKRGQCSDGMSDTVYAYTATFRYGETEYTGCAEQAKAK